MFETSELDEYKSKFIELEITDDETMITVLNYLDMIAEIGYESYIQKINI